MGGRGVRLGKQSSVRHEKFFIAIDIDDSNHEVTVRSASAVEPQWLTINGSFKEQILPIEIKTRKGIEIFETDEHPKPDTSMETLSSLRTAFKKDGVVTAGNASGINDGAAAVALMSNEEAKKRKIILPFSGVIQASNSLTSSESLSLCP